MSKSKKIEKIALDELDTWLGSTGYLYPRDDLELERFNHLYQDFDFKLKPKNIDPTAIIGNEFLDQVGTLAPKNIKLKQEAEILRMVARKGEKKIPQHIIDRMLGKHKDQSDS